MSLGALLALVVNDYATNYEGMIFVALNKKQGMGFIKTNDAQNGTEVKLYYEDWGHGQPVIFIHGWPSSHEMWEHQLAELPKHGLRCIAYDRRGFGKSDKPWGDYNYDVLADDLKAVLEELDLQDVILVGFSMGGGEVVRYFSRHGGARVKKAVLVSAVTPYMLKTDTNPNGVPQEVFDDMAKQMQEDRFAFLENFGKDFFGVTMLNHPVSGPYLDNFFRLACNASLPATLECAKAFSTTDFRDEMGSVSVPTLIIHGDADKTVPIDTAGKEAAKMIPNNQFLIYEGGPHGIFYTEKERLNQDLLDFISTVQ